MTCFYYNSLRVIPHPNPSFLFTPLTKTYTSTPIIPYPPFLKKEEKNFSSKRIFFFLVSTCFWKHDCKSYSPSFLIFFLVCKRSLLPSPVSGFDFIQVREAIVNGSEKKKFFFLLSRFTSGTEGTAKARRREKRFLQVVIHGDRLNISRRFRG